MRQDPPGYGARAARAVTGCQHLVIEARGPSFGSSRNEKVLARLDSSTVRRRQLLTVIDSNSPLDSLMVR